MHRAFAVLFFCAALICAPPADGTLLHGSGSLAGGGCPASADGATISAPSSCTLSDSWGAWSFGAPDGMGANYNVNLNGAQDEFSANSYENGSDTFGGLPSGKFGVFGQTIELNQGLNAFVQMAPGFCKNSLEPMPAGNPWLVRVTPAFEAPQWVQTGGPSQAVPGKPFSYGASSSWTFYYAMLNVPQNGTVTIPALPTGVPYWIGSGAIASTSLNQQNVTVTAAAGSSMFCGTFHGKGLLDIGPDGVPGYGPINFTFSGASSTQPFTIGHVIAGVNAGPWYGLNIDTGTDGGTVNITNMSVVDADMCIHVAGEANVTLTNVSTQDCSSGSGSGWGFNHNVYVSGTTQTGNESNADLVWNGGYDINGHGDGTGLSSGDIFKSRFPQTTLENMVIGENCSSASCEERWVLSYDCGGNNTVTHSTVEMPALTNSNGHEIISAGGEIGGATNTWRSDSECWPAHIMNGATVSSGSQNQITVSANPQILGISAGDCVNPNVFAALCTGLGSSNGTIASITGTGPYTITLNPVTTGLQLVSFNSSTGAITVNTQIGGVNADHGVGSNSDSSGVFQLSGVTGVGSAVSSLDGTFTATTGTGQYVLSFTCSACIGQTLTSLSAGNLYDAPVGSNESFVVSGYITASGSISNSSNTITFSTLDPTQSEISVGWAVKDSSGCLPVGDTVASIVSTTQITLAQAATSGGPCGSITVTMERNHQVNVSSSIIINDASGTNYLNSLIAASYIPVTISAPMTIVTNGTLSTGTSINGGETITQLCATTGINCYATRAAAAAANPSQWPSTDAWGNPCCAWPYLPPHP